MVYQFDFKFNQQINAMSQPRRERLRAEFPSVHELPFWQGKKKKKSKGKPTC